MLLKFSPESTSVLNMLDDERRLPPSLTPDELYGPQVTNRQERRNRSSTRPLYRPEREPYPRTDYVLWNHGGYVHAVNGWLRAVN